MPRQGGARGGGWLPLWLPSTAGWTTVLRNSQGFSRPFNTHCPCLHIIMPIHMCCPCFLMNAISHAMIQERLHCKCRFQSGWGREWMEPGGSLEACCCAAAAAIAAGWATLDAGPGCEQRQSCLHQVAAGGALLSADRVQRHAGQVRGQL